MNIIPHEFVHYRYYFHINAGGDLPERIYWICGEIFKKIYIEGSNYHFYNNQ